MSKRILLRCTLGLSTLILTVMLGVWATARHTNAQTTDNQEATPTPMTMPGMADQPEAIPAPGMADPTGEANLQAQLAGLMAQWVELQARQQGGNPLPAPAVAGQLKTLFNQMRTLLAAAPNPQTRQSLASSMVGIWSGMMNMMPPLLAQMSTLPPSERMAQMMQMMDMMSQMTQEMMAADMGAMGAVGNTMAMTATTPMDANMLQNMMNMMNMMSMMFMMGQMQGMMNNALPMGNTGGNQLQNSMAIMDRMDLMMGSCMSGMDSCMCMTGGMGATTSPGAMPMDSTSPFASVAPAPVVASILTQTAIVGTVMVSVTPVNLTSTAGDTLDFEVTLEGDAEALAVDLTQVARLQINDQEVSATAWEVTSSSEQLVSGLLRFPATGAGESSILSSVTKVALVFRNLVGENEQTFTWNLAGQ